MDGALGMIQKFSYYNLRTCRELRYTLPEVYPFALKGKPITMLPPANATPVAAVAA
jgi:hypothetical protein